MRHVSTTKSDSSKVSKKTREKRVPAREAHFKVRAQPNSVVYIAGTFNGWDPVANPMEPDGNGFYIARLVLPAGRHEYKFLVDGAWHLDPTCAQCVPNAFGSQNHVIEIC